jgi:hypothetical protein
MTVCGLWGKEGTCDGQILFGARRARYRLTRASFPNPNAILGGPIIILLGFLILEFWKVLVCLYTGFSGPILGGFCVFLVFWFLKSEHFLIELL